jgi:hypothetical protein
MQAGHAERIPGRTVAVIMGPEHGRRSARVNIRLGLVDGCRLGNVEGHFEDGRSLLRRRVVVLARTIDDVPGQRPMDVPAVIIVVARRVKVLQVPRKRVFGIPVTRERFVTMNPRDRPTSKDDRQSRTHQPRASAALRRFLLAATDHWRRLN